jgi:hypothetical protein
MQALYGYKQDKHPYIRNCNCTCNYDPLANNYPLYKYFPEYK